MKKGILNSGTIVIINKPVTSCGCSDAEQGTIAKVEKTVDEDKDGEYPLIFCPNGCTSYVKGDDFDLTDENQSEELENKFSKANYFSYATV